MGVFFTGTSTGKTYEVGKSYVTGDNRVMVAQPDGSFVKQGNLVGYTDGGRAVVDNAGQGSVSAGSSRSYDADWFASGSDAARLSGGARPNPASGAVASAGGEVSPVQGGVRIPRPSGGSIGGGLAAATFQRTNGWSGKDDPPQDNLLGGFHWQASPRFTNAELFEARYGEVGETLIGLAVLGADIGYNARRLFDQQGYTMEGLAAGVEAAPFNAFNALLDWREEQASKAAALEKVEEEARADFNEAWDYRMELQAVEADKQGMWSKAPAVW